VQSFCTGPVFLFANHGQEKDSDSSSKCLATDIQILMAHWL